jgi:hypothetical protein
MRGFVLRILVPVVVVLIGVVITLSIAGAFGGSGRAQRPETAAVGEAVAPSSGFATHVQVIPPPKRALTPSATTPAPPTSLAAALGTTIAAGATGATAATGTTGATASPPKPKTKPTTHAQATTPKKTSTSPAAHTPATSAPAKHVTATSKPVVVVKPTPTPVVTHTVTPVAKPVHVVSRPTAPVKHTTPPVAASTTKPSSLSGPSGLQAGG